MQSRISSRSDKYRTRFSSCSSRLLTLTSLLKLRCRGLRGRPLADDVGVLHPGLDAVGVAIGGRLAAALVLQAVLHRRLGPDQRLAADLHELGIVVQRPDNVASELRR